MRTDLTDLIRSARPSLLDWDRAILRVLKDPKRPLSVVSDLGAVHGGIELDSAVYRLSDGGRPARARAVVERRGLGRPVARGPRG